MNALEGKLKKVFIESVRDDLKYYARIVDDSARKTESYCVKMARDIEELNNNSAGMNIPLEDINTQYNTINDNYGNSLLKKLDIYDQGSFLSLATSCQRVPLSADVMRQLKIYENIKPAMLRMYDEVEFIDGNFLFDVSSNILLFRTEYRFDNDFDVPGIDLASIYDFGITFYDWFKFVDMENNPYRRALWSSIAFIAVEHDWIMHLKAPFYKNRYSANEKMIGMFSVHLNLDWIVNCTISKSAVKMMIVKDDSTLIGLNDSAKADIKLETFNKDLFKSMSAVDQATTQFKKKFVYETLNLEFGKSEEIASFAVKLKSELQFRHALFGKTYTVLRERSPELGLNFVALLDE